MRIPQPRVSVKLPFLLFCCLLPLSALSAEQTFVSPRAHGMAGANTASVEDASAQYYNPAALGFFSTHFVQDSRHGHQTPAAQQNDLLLDASLGYRIGGDMGTYMRELADIDIEALGNISGTSISSSELADIITVLSIFTDLSDESNSFALHGSVGTSVRMKQVAIGVRAFGRFVGRVSDVDTVNLGVSFSDQNEFNAALENVENSNNILPGGFAGYTPQHFSAQEQADLNTAGFTDNAIDVLDYQIGQSIDDGLLDPADVDTTSQLLMNMMLVINGTLSGGDLDENTTAVAVTGLGYVEIPVSYGHAFNERLAIGISPKLMMGRVYGTRVLVFDDDNEKAVAEIGDAYNDSQTLGIDAGIMYRINNLQLGLTGRNLNSPEFDGFTSSDGVTFKDISLDPQLTLGAAWMPHEHMVFEVDIDLLAADNGMTSYEHQYLAVGAEWRVLSALALRAGAYQNIAEDDIGLVLTGGLGIQTGPLRFDLGLSLAPDFIPYDGNDIPPEAAMSLGLLVAF